MTYCGTSVSADPSRWYWSTDGGLVNLLDPSSDDQG